MYNFPIWLRRLTHKQIADSKKAEADAYKTKGKKKGTTSIDMSSPVPDHIKSALKNPKLPPNKKPTSFKTTRPKK